MKQENTHKKVLFIFPRTRGSQVFNDAGFPFPLLGLTQLASAFPSQYDLTLIDESVGPVTGFEQVDLVCITTMTATADRAYELGDLYLSHGITVIIGGAHATVLPDEASRHASSVVIGEAENIIPELLADFEAGQLKPRYKAGEYTSLAELNPPRVDLLNWRHRLFLASLQTTRGCPNSCDFCSVPQVFGRKLRQKSIETIKLELQTAKKYRSKYMFVVMIISPQTARAPGNSWMCLNSMVSHGWGFPPLPQLKILIFCRNYVILDVSPYSSVLSHYFSQMPLLKIENMQIPPPFLLP